MHELTGPERPLAGAVAERRGITATVPLAFLVAFLVILLQLGDILEILIRNKVSEHYPEI
tara:strand:- start:4 stop:183 length:180 start_codon:yes stop_codon:yes gene_type:complete